MTRREFGQKLTTAALLTDLSFKELCYAGARFIAIVFNVDASEVYSQLKRIDERGQITDLVRIILRAAYVDTAGASAPSSSSQLGLPVRRQTQSGQGRAFYLLDSLGDEDQNGRIIAFDPDAQPPAVRGDVGMRPFQPGQPPIDLRHIAASDDGNLLIVSQAGPPSQWILVDAASLTILGQVMAPAGRVANRAIFSSDGKLAFVTSNDDQFATSTFSTVHVIDTAARRIVGDVPLPPEALIHELTITPDHGLLFGVGGRYIHVVDVRTGTFARKVDVIRSSLDPLGFMGGMFGGVAMHPSGARFYSSVLRFQRDNVERYAIGVFDTRTVEKIDEIDVPERPQALRQDLAVDPSGRFLVYSWPTGPAVRLFDLDSREVVFSISPEEGFTLAGFATA